MIRLPADINPPTDALEQLAEWQSEIKGNFVEQSALAKAQFKKRNTKRNATFKKLKETLTRMCSGARRCAYCEDSVADEVEHIYPKDLFPEKVFLWENYLYACGNCNGPKNNQFAVYCTDNRALQRVNPPHWPKNTQPPAGTAVIINPREEDPMQYALLDLVGTFQFVAVPDSGTIEHERFQYTFEEVLRLNEREFLRQAREEAYGDYKARLLEYNRQKENHADPTHLDKLIAGIQKKGHPTVWREMQRWYSHGWLLQTDAELHHLFEANPEALGW